jgi:5'-nucleotidase/UDP-sugar diphosphatase
MARLAAGATAHRLTIIHMNDFHSRHEAVDGSALSCKPGGKPDCFGGAARLASAIAAERGAAEAAGRVVLQVDAGDQFQGSLFYTAWHGEAELAVMHLLGTEVMTAGNHEFDNGPENLARFVRGAKFPVLSANTDATGEPALAGLLKPHVMVQKGALKIGIVGLTTRETATGSSPGPNVRFNPPGVALAKSAAALRADGAQVVVALSHLGVDEDRALAGHIGGVDVFVGGHSHTLLSDGESGALGPAHGAFDGPAGRAVVVQAGCFGRYLGRLDIDLDENFKIVAYGGDTRHIGFDLPEEPRVAAVVAGYAAQLDLVRRRKVGQAPAPVTNDGCRVGECGLGNFVAEALLATVHGADLAIVNAGSLRTGLPGGDITIGDVLTMLPFSNTVATLKLRGADLLAALANGVSRAGGGGFPQIAGAKLVWNKDSKTLVSVALRQTDGSFAPLEPDRVYLVVTNNFIRAGGDGYVAFRDRAIEPYDAGPLLNDAVVDAITAAGVLRPVTDGRISAA